MAENDKLIADGSLMDRNLTLEKLEEVSQALAKKIKHLVPTGNKAYVAAARRYRQKKEVWMCTTERGRSKPLIHDERGKRVNRAKLKAGGWKSVLGLYTSTNHMNVNRVEKRVHQILRDHPMSIWMVCGAGAVHPDKNKKMLRFTVSLIYGPTKGFQFRADERLGRPLSDRSNDAVSSEEDSSDGDSSDEYSSEED